MKLLTIRNGSEYRLAVQTEQGILDLAEAAHTFASEGVPLSVPMSMEEAVAGGAHAVELMRNVAEKAAEKAADSRQLWKQLSDVEFGPCLPRAGKIICVGQNYKAHVDEYTVGSFATPVLFNKYDNTIAAHQETIRIPADSEQVDYEAELAVVIGKVAKDVPEEQALDYVFGYCNANDFSARDLQFRTVQWLLGKSPDGFCPIGPWLVTKDEIVDPSNLDIKCFVNGELRQSSNTRMMIFNMKFLISYISKYITLQPGDIILTGTPEGTILGYPDDQKKWLQSGDVVTVEVEGLGQLVNTIGG